MRIVQRRLTETEIDILIHEVEKFPCIVYIPRRCWESFDEIFIVESEHGVMMALCVVHILSGWVKIGPLIVLAKYQSKGLSKVLLERIFEKHITKNLYIGTSNQRLQKNLGEYGFLESSFFKIPLVVKLHLLKELIIYIDFNFIVKFCKKFLSRLGKKYRFYIKQNNNK